MKSTKKLTIYITTALIGLMIAIPVAMLRGLSTDASLVNNMWYLSDGFFVSGMLLTGFGALIWVSTTGFFDMFSYAGHSLLVLFTSLKNPKEHKKFYDYKMEKEEKRGKAKPELFLVGVAFILISLVFLYLYYNL